MDDILKRAEGFEALAQKRHWGDAIKKERGDPLELEQMREQLASSLKGEVAMTDATVSALQHAAKLAHKASEELAKGRKPQARMNASLALETLQDIISRLEQ